MKNEKEIRKRLKKITERPFYPTCSDLEEEEVLKWVLEDEL